MTSLETRPSDAFTNDRKHVFHSWSAQSLINPIVVAGGEGAWFWDDAGRRYLDFSSQLVNVNIGHQHPKLVAAIKEQADRLCTIAPIHANDARSEAARLIAEVAPGDLNMVFFTNGGAEATENAMRMARLHTGRLKILTTYRSYHGATAAAIQATGDPRRRICGRTGQARPRFQTSLAQRGRLHAFRTAAGAASMHEAGVRCQLCRIHRQTQRRRL